ncbi:hypothetical protein LXL04_004579 [Taraxacum kok-saghyz]
MYKKNGSAKLTTIRQDIGGNQRLQLTVPPDVWYGAFPIRDYNVSMVDWDSYSVVKNAPRDAEKCFSLVGTKTALSFEWRKDAGDEGGAMNGRTIDCDCDIFVVVGGSIKPTYILTRIAPLFHTDCPPHHSCPQPRSSHARFSATCHYLDAFFLSTLAQPPIPFQIAIDSYKIDSYKIGSVHSFGTAISIDSYKIGSVLIEGLDHKQVYVQGTPRSSRRLLRHCSSQVLIERLDHKQVYVQGTPPSSRKLLRHCSSQRLERIIFRSFELQYRMASERFKKNHRRKGIDIENARKVLDEMPQRGWWTLILECSLPSMLPTPNKETSIPEVKRLTDDLRFQ